MNIVKDIEKLRKQYESEWQNRYDSYIFERDRAKKELNEVATTDYVKDLADTYKLSLMDLEDVYESWASIQRKTKGLAFSMDSYIRSLKPRSIPKGAIESFVEQVVGECQDAMAAVERSRRVEDDVKPQKIFCQCLVDFRYIAKNAEKLIVESGMPERQRKADGADAQRRLDYYNGLLKGKLTSEGLSCHNSLLKLKAQIEESCLKTGGALIGGELLRDVNASRFLMGLAQEQVLPQTVKFAKEAMGLPTNIFASNPVYFDPKNGNGSIIINAPKRFFEEDGCYDLFTKIFFSFAQALPISSLLLCGMEKTSEQIVRALSAKIQKELGKSNIFGGEIASGGRGFELIVKSLMDKYSERSGVYRAMDGVSNFFEYNKASTDNPQPAILCIINNYPVGFDSVDREAMVDFENTLLKKGAEKGIFVVLCQDSDSSAYREKKPFDGSKTKSDVMVIDEDGLVTYNGQHISTDITAADFSASAFWKELKDDEKSATVIGLEKFLKKAEAGRKNVPPFYEKLVVPMGKSGGNQFDMSIKTSSTQGFGLILGAADSGKSTLLHTFILSATYFYPPDELQIYLMDFKDNKQSPEFSNYIQRNDDSNMFLPHIRYISLKNKKEVAIDLLNKIEVEISHRSIMMSRLKAGTSNITVYNSSEAVKSGKLPKIPVAMFIIDECNAMLSNDDPNDLTMNMLVETIVRKVATVLKRARAYGIEIFFSGQELVSGITSNLPQINTRITLSMKDETAGILDSLYSSVPYEKAESIASEIGMRKGTILHTNDAGLTNSLVRIAFGGESGQAEHLRITKAIREKYKNNPASKFLQTAAGSLESFPVTLIKDCEEGSYVLIEDTDNHTEEELEIKCREMEQNKAEETKFYLPMGASSATTLKISMSYSQKESAANYVAFANESKLMRIESNVINAAMEKKGGTIYYCSTPADRKKFIAQYGEVQSKVENNVTFIDDKTDIARRILSLEQLFIKRKKQLDKESVDLDPIYLVLHKIEWLTPADRDTDWVPSLDGIVQVDAAPTQSGISEQEQAELDAAGIDDDLASLLGGINMDAFNSSAPTAKKADKKAAKKEEPSFEGMFTKTEVADALATLYGKGNRCAIFILLASNTWKPIDYFREQATGGNVESYGIYGSFDDLNTQKAAEGGATNCAYITPSNAFTRLIDYSPTKYPEWWKKIK